MPTILAPWRVPF